METGENLCFVDEIAKIIIEPMFLTDLDNGFEVWKELVLCEKMLRRNSYVG